ncbi:PQQ-dependent sugar dehydrogenase [Paractinoplanes lichenicola]|uniref:PQQ-dependent sugar dehydrogenase n=1 Tax=Paractinoplanes lichenicola TaxID=2802976 RepID=A0ABS1W045_9ACTN|nr:PQQ-dependent sugar dehydrogenase [Actinoplanes lichenicola]MBL7260111.1 PQQ-dependent sugar dehydrogenase [Actinoplanes lichenicola]
MRRMIVVGGAVAALALGAAQLAVSSPAAALEPDLANPQVVATGLTVPWGLGFLPDGSALVAERNSARVLRVTPGSAPTTVTTIAGVAATGEAGLLGLAVSPTFAQDNFVYVYFTAASDNRIARFRLDAPQTQQVILSGLAKASIHDGGRIAFGPDGMLYAGVGDANVTANAQNQQSRNGKILRMRPDGGVPATGNPFPGSLVYSLGHRNPQGLAWDAQGRLYAAEFGQNTWDEVNQIVAGGNYGWPVVEGRSDDTRYRNPIVVWSTAEASPSGAAIDGQTLYVAALRGQRLWSVPLDGAGGAGTPVALLQGRYGRLRTVERAPDGALWVTTSNRDGRGTPTTGDDRILRFPPLGAPTTPPPAAACSLRWAADQWGSGFTANVSVTNLGAARSSWTLTFTFPGNQQVTGAWNAAVSQAGAAVTARNAGWNGALATGATATFGLQATYSGTNAGPTDFRLDGTPCAVTS